MTEHQQINKAKKISALMMKSPYKGERVAAATLLHKFLNEHGLTTADVGIGNIDLGHLVNNTNNESFDGADIIEVNYMQPYHTICDGWVEDLILRVCLAYGVRFGVRDDTVRIVGFRDDVNAVKTSIITFRRYIEDRIVAHRFVNERQSLSYATCFTNTITKGIIYPKDTAKSEKLAGYMFKHYGRLAVEIRCDGYVRYDVRTFVAAQVDARDYKYRNAA